jgi:hypothetical protein
MPIVAVAILFIALILGPTLGYAWWLFRRAAVYEATDAELANHGTDTEAKVQSQRIALVRNGRGLPPLSHCYITYQYLVSQPSGIATRQTVETRIAFEDFHKMHVGYRLQVRYLPDHPATAQIVEGATELRMSDHLRHEGSVSMVVGVFIVVIILVVSSFLIINALLSR